jgi:hypothetical protein
VSVGGAGIPRLQDLSYIEVAASRVAAEASFEQIRRALVARAAEIARDSDTPTARSMSVKAVADGAPLLAVTWRNDLEGLTEGELGTSA